LKGGSLVSIKSRIDGLFRELAPRGLWDGASGKDLSLAYFSKARPDYIRPGVQRMAAFIVLIGIDLDLCRAAQSRDELEETAKADLYRKQQGWQVVLTPERRAEWEERIRQYEIKAIDTRGEWGIADDATDEQVWERLMELADEFGFTDAEKKKLRRSLRRRPTSVFQMNDRRSRPVTSQEGEQ
jgi:hypothetical protein